MLAKEVVLMAGVVEAEGMVSDLVAALVQEAGSTAEVAKKGVALILPHMFYEQHSKLNKCIRNR